MTEHSLQTSIFEWAAHRKDLPELSLMYAIPNGGLRHKAVAAKLKREGVKPGVPDICLPLPCRGRFHGLYLELKTPKGKLSDEQRDWLAALSSRGYKTVIGTTFEAITQGLEEYVIESRGWGATEPRKNQYNEG